MVSTTAPISVQLYSLREASAENFDAVLEQLANIGYAGVEPFNLFGKSPTEFKQQAESLGMRISSSHYPWVNRADDLGQVADTLAALGLTRAPGGYMPDDFADMDAVKRTTEQVANLVDTLAGHGLTLCLHNHWWEYRELDGVVPYHYLQDQVPGVEFEIDTYWAANFGKRDPAEEVARVASRAPLLHIKDGPLVRDEPHVAAGTGNMDIPAVLAAADPNTLEWAIVELDACATDMMTAVAQSYTYLTTNNLAKGNV